MGIFGDSSTFTDYDRILDDVIGTYYRIAKEPSDEVFFGSARPFYEVVVPSFVNYFLKGYTYRAGFVYLYLHSANFLFAHVAALADVENTSGYYEDPHLLVYDTKFRDGKCLHWQYDYALSPKYASDAETSMDLIAAYAGEHGRWYSDAGIWQIVRPYVGTKLFCDVPKDVVAAMDSALGSSGSTLDLALDEIKNVLERYWPS